jgi:hypothetical protein
MKLIDNIVVALGKRWIKGYIRRMKKMAEQESKPWYLSCGVIGGLVTMAIGLAGAFGIGAQLEGERDAITNTIIQVATAVAGAVAVWGRVKAKKTLTLK